MVSSESENLPTSARKSLVKPEPDESLPEGSIQVKYINNCGPYGYRVRYINGRHNWEYLGKNVDGVAPGFYPPDTPMKFKKRTGWVFAGDWSGRRISSEDEEEGLE